MLSVLICVALSSLVICSQSQNACIWGRPGINSLINGLYNQTGIYNAAPYYTKSVTGDSEQCGIVGIYNLYYHNNQWKIGPELGTSYYAYCTAASSTIVSCSGSWLISQQGSWVEDPNVYITNNKCPSWDCNGISVSGSTATICNGNFETVEGTQNAYKKIGENYWIYFSPNMFSWICSNALEPNSCVSTYLRKSSEGWEDLTFFDSILNKGDLGNIDCLPFPTKPPTLSPSVSPTYMPTQIPVKSSFSQIYF